MSVCVNYCMLNLCVCVKLLYVKFVCVCVKLWYVRKLCVKLLYVKFVCVCEVMVCERWGVTKLCMCE